VVLQLGGCNPAKLAECSVLAREAGFDEVNLNVGCPSPRVKAGSFGACLMTEPRLVAECLTAMASSGLPATVKCRTGVDDHDSYDHFK
jgi:tRNA-dihydrouridine synthase A